MIFIDDCLSIAVDGSAEIVRLKGKQSVVEAGRDSVVTVVCMDKNQWSFYNNPLKGSLVITKPEGVVKATYPVKKWSNGV